ncbi:MAG: ABC transporter substrate-binding protein [Actinomycetes bacterium]
MTRLGSSLATFAAGALIGALAVVEVVPPTTGQLATTQVGDIGTDVVGDGTGVLDPGGQADGSLLAEGGSGAAVTGPGGVDTSVGDGVTDQSGSGAAGPGTPGTPGQPGTPGTPGQPGQPGTPNGPAAPPAGVRCEAGANGGATDRGVTASSIKLATTVVESGIGSAFLGETRFAMEAVKNQVNRAGGICGRQLQVTYRDDGWDTQLGAQFLRNFIAEGVFAIPVGPSSEGLNAVIEAGDFDKSETPVVGTDGLIERQYLNGSKAQQWVWPIAVATVSSARIMAKDAFDRMKKAGVTPKAADFSVVFDANYKFGSEGAEAFNQEVKRLTGADIPGYAKNSGSCNQSYCGLQAGQSSYSSQVQAFTEGRFVALFLEPDTALKWMNDPNTPKADQPRNGPVGFGYGAAQPLFTRSFGENCKAKCHTMVTWTGFKPFEEQYRSDPAVQAYVNDMAATCRSCDPNNQFTLGAYIGMQLLVDGLEATGPNLTRRGLKAQLDRMKFRCDLCLKASLDYTPDNRFVATTMQGWVIQYSGTFAGWKAGNIVPDPRF